MKIEPLRYHMHLIDEIAALHQAEWAHFDPNFTVENRVAAITNITGNDEIPSIVVAIENSDFCGSAALVEQDMDSRPELSPWLAAVFVKEAWRCQGIAKSLIKFFEREAKNFGVHKLYLSTQFASNLYASLGWKTIDKILEKGIEVDVMRIETGT